MNDVMQSTNYTKENPIKNINTKYITFHNVDEIPLNTERQTFTAATV